MKGPKKIPRMRKMVKTSSVPFMDRFFRLKSLKRILLVRVRYLKCLHLQTLPQAVFVSVLGFNAVATVFSVIKRQSACLVFNPITVNNFASPFNYTPVGRASDSVMAPT